MSQHLTVGQSTSSSDNPAINSDSRSGPNQIQKLVAILRDPGLKLRERVALALICNHVGSNATTWVTNKTLAGELGVSETTVDEILKGLRQDRRIASESLPRPSDRLKRKCRHLWLLEHKSTPDDPRAAQGARRPPRRRPRAADIPASQPEHGLPCPPEHGLPCDGRTVFRASDARSSVPASHGLPCVHLNSPGELKKEGGQPTHTGDPCVCEAPPSGREEGEEEGTKTEEGSLEPDQGGSHVEPQAEAHPGPGSQSPEADALVAWVEEHVDDASWSTWARKQCASYPDTWVRAALDAKVVQEDPGMYGPKYLLGMLQRWKSAGSCNLLEPKTSRGRQGKAATSAPRGTPAESLSPGLRQAFDRAISKPSATVKAQPPATLKPDASPHEVEAALWPLQQEVGHEAGAAARASLDPNLRDVADTWVSTVHSKLLDTALVVAPEQTRQFLARIGAEAAEKSLQPGQGPQWGLSRPLVALLLEQQALRTFAPPVVFAA